MGHEVSDITVGAVRARVFDEKLREKSYWVLKDVATVHHTNVVRDNDSTSCMFIRPCVYDSLSMG